VLWEAVSKTKHCCSPKIKHFGTPNLFGPTQNFRLATPLYRCVHGRRESALCAVRGVRWRTAARCERTIDELHALTQTVVGLLEVLRQSGRKESGVYFWRMLVTRGQSAVLCVLCVACAVRINVSHAAAFTLLLAWLSQPRRERSVSPAKSGFCRVFVWSVYQRPESCTIRQVVWQISIAVVGFYVKSVVVKTAAFSVNKLWSLRLATGFSGAAVHS